MAFQKTKMRGRSALLISLTLVTAAIMVGLSGCAPTPTEGAGSVSASPGIQATDVWVRSVDDISTENMTALFGVFTNETDEDINIMGGTTDAAVTDTALDAHEVVTDESGKMQMQELNGGIVIPAHGSVTLKPGSYHVMFWDLKKPLEVGQKIPVTLKLSNGTTLSVEGIVRTMENYESESSPEPSMSGGMGN